MKTKKISRFMQRTTPFLLSTVLFAVGITSYSFLKNSSSTDNTFIQKVSAADETVSIQDFHISEGPKSFEDEYCTNLEFNNYSDWRIPYVDEVKGIIKNDMKNSESKTLKQLLEGTKSYNTSLESVSIQVQDNPLYRPLFGTLYRGNGFENMRPLNLLFYPFYTGIDLSKPTYSTSDSGNVLCVR